MQHAYIYIEKHIHTNFIPYGHMICLTYQLLDCATLEIPAKKDHANCFFMPLWVNVLKHQGSGRHADGWSTMTQNAHHTLHLHCSRKSPRGPTERTPKPENLIALATSLGVRWDSVPFNFWWNCLPWWASTFWMNLCHWLWKNTRQTSRNNRYWYLQTWRPRVFRPKFIPPPWN